MKAAQMWYNIDMDKEQNISYYVQRVLDLKQQESDAIKAIESMYAEKRAELAVEAGKEGVLDEVRQRLWSM